MFHFVFSYTSVYLCFLQKRISVFFGSDEKRVDYAAVVEASSSSSLISGA